MNNKYRKQNFLPFLSISLLFISLSWVDSIFSECAYSHTDMLVSDKNKYPSAYGTSREVKAREDKQKKLIEQKEIAQGITAPTKIVGTSSIQVSVDSGTLTGPMKIDKDSNGVKYASSGVRDQGSVSYTIYVTDPGQYSIWAKVLAPDSNHDSFYVSIDGGPEDIYDTAEKKWKNKWQWTAVNGRAGSGPASVPVRLFNLSAGQHTITFRARETNSTLASLIVTKDLSFDPNLTGSNTPVPAPSIAPPPASSPVSNPSPTPSAAPSSAPSPIASSNPSPAPNPVPPPEGSSFISLNAASAVLTGAMEIHTDAQGHSTILSTTENQGMASYQITVTDPGQYVIWAQVFAPDSNHDSFFVSVDGGAEDIYDTAEQSWISEWQWTAVNGRAGAGPASVPVRLFSLSAGQHTITFRAREAGAILGDLIITQDQNFSPDPKGSKPQPPNTPSPTPSAAPSPKPSSNPSPAPSAVPSPTPSPKPSPNPSPVPSIAPNPVPSSTPAPIPNPKPTPLPIDPKNGIFVSNAAQLQDVLSGKTSVPPGTTVWMREGTYSGTFVSNLTGTAMNPIIVRAYPGERVVLDGGSSGKPVIDVRGGYTWFWGIEVMSSDPVRQTDSTGSHPTTDVVRGDGVSIGNYGVDVPGIKLINMIIHDTRQGVSLWKEAKGTEVYGTLIYNNGWTGPDRGHGHGIYVQNVDSEKTVKDNIIFGQFSHGFHAYGSDAAYVNNLTVDGNTIFGNDERNFLLGSGNIAQNPVVTDNMFYKGINQIGYQTGVQNAVVEGNYFVGIGTEDNRAVSFTQVQNSSFKSFTDNKVYGTILNFEGANFSQLASPDNQYQASSPTSGFTALVRPNDYEQGRANLTIYNWSLSNSVSVDISNSGLKIGDTYEIHNVQNYFGETIKGVYDGRPVNVRMTGWSVIQAVGGGRTAETSTFPAFGSFVIEKI